MQKERVTVMDLVTVLMVMLDVKENWFVEATIVKSLVSTTMRRMTAVRNQLQQNCPNLMNLNLVRNHCNFYSS